ncbi:MAG: hypothetical protein FWE19_08435 [Oscillospiraceae bacterium]|nr:hypothetical protein [Oscillospiraceae bacterium]
MSTLNILLLSVLGALALACIVGVVVGKYQVRKAAGQVRGLLSPRERAIYAASVALGVTMLLVGIFYQGPAPRQEQWEFMGGSYYEDGSFADAEASVVTMPPARQARGGVVVMG